VREELSRSRLVAFFANIQKYSHLLTVRVYIAYTLPLRCPLENVHPMNVPSRCMVIPDALAQIQPSGTAEKDLFGHVHFFDNCCPLW